MFKNFCFVADEPGFVKCRMHDIKPESPFKGTEKDPNMPAPFGNYSEQHADMPPIRPC